MKEIMDNGPVQGNAMPFCVCMSSLNMLVFYCIYSLDVQLTLTHAHKPALMFGCVTQGGNQNLFGEIA